MVAKKGTTAVAAPATPVTPSPAVKEGKDVKAKAPKTAAPATPAAETKPAKAVEAKPAKAAKTTEAKPVTPAVENAATTAPEVVENPLDVVFAKLTAATALFKEIQSNLKVLQKTYEKLRKIAEKQDRKRANARSSPSGFAKEANISDEMCAFLNVPKGTLMSRTSTTRALNAYIKANNLYDPSNRRIILPDAQMKKILVLEPGVPLSFFSLQRAIKHHFSPVKA